MNPPSAPHTGTPTSRGARAAKPEIDPLLCVHGHVAAATCRACVDACPGAALVLDARALGIDEDACTGCGLCRPACPVGAIGFDWAARPVPVEAATARAFIACSGSGIQFGPGVTACLDGLGEVDMAALEARGAVRLVVAEHSCPSCVLRRSGAFDRALARTNDRRSARGAAGFDLELIPVAAWLRQRAGAIEARNDVDQGRRGLFRLFLSAGDGEASSHSERVTSVPVRHMPRIAPERCRGCDACVRVCRFGALRIETGAEGAAYAIDAAKCTGCGVCVDVCDAGAMGIAEGDAKGCDRLGLREGSCRQCGATFHFPSARDDDGTRCFVCRQKARVGRLFQVRE